MESRTKILCTVGPASASVATLTTMMRSGMDAARLNFSHATHADHRRLVKAVRVAAKQAGKLVPIVGDLQGPKIRLGNLPEAGVELAQGSHVVLSTATMLKNVALPVTYKNLHKDVQRGDRILIDDGLLELKIEKIVGREIHARVVNGGRVTSHKGMNFPDSTLRVSALTAKDREDAKFGIEEGAEWLALSFVTSARDVRALKTIVKRLTPQGQVPARVIVKIEKHEAIAHFDEILAVADGVMIARGDLGVEIPAQEVPERQKEIIEKCRRAGKPVVVATQMLDSMIRNPRPTRAEVSDVANAVFDHTDAVMLSGESASGKYPREAVRMMAVIVEEAEQSRFDDLKMGDSISRLAEEGAIDGVLVAHELAPWGESILRGHPEIPLFLFCASEREARQHALRWGVVPMVMGRQSAKTFTTSAVKELRAMKLLKGIRRMAVVTSAKPGNEIDIVAIK